MWFHLRSGCGFIILYLISGCGFTYKIVANCEGSRENCMLKFYKKIYKPQLLKVLMRGLISSNFAPFSQIINICRISGNIRIK